jgi:elongation factor P
MIDTNDIRRGMIIEVDGEVFYVIEQQHIKPGKGSAFVRVKLKNLRTKAIIERTLNAGVKVPLAKVEEKKLQFLYKEKKDYNFIDLETYEQFTIPQETLGDSSKFLKENDIVTALLYKDEIVSIELPIYSEFKVIETAPPVRGDTVAGSGKPAIIETGATVQVPFFVEVGDIIKVDTRTGEYVERVEK